MADDTGKKIFDAVEKELKRIGISDEADLNFESFCDEVTAKVFGELVKGGIIDEEDEDAEEIIETMIDDLYGLY
jgi:hypothetical protein